MASILNQDNNIPFFYPFKVDFYLKRIIRKPKRRYSGNHNRGRSDN